MPPAFRPALALLAALVSLTACVKRPDQSTTLADSLRTTCPNPAWCLNDMTKAKLVAVTAATAAWEITEKQRPYWSSTETYVELPLADSILKPQATDVVDGHHKTGFGRKTALFTIRRAAFFTSQLFPELKTITVLRVNTSNPPPAASLGDTHTHGHNADIGYLLAGDGSDARQPIDIARNFWFAYAILKSGHHFQMLSDYRDEMMAYRDQLVDAQIMTANDFWETEIFGDKMYNHDSHLHVGTN